MARVFLQLFLLIPFFLLSPFIAILPFESGQALASHIPPRWEPVANKPGCVVWDSEPDDGTRITWSGACKDGKANGKGVLSWHYKAGEEWLEIRYEGSITEGQVTGRGVMTWPSGERYEGELKNWKPHGRGILISREGGRYEGEFVEGQRHGQGLVTWPSGSSFKGPYVNNLEQGIGDCRTAEGRQGRCRMDNGNIVEWLE